MLNRLFNIFPSRFYSRRILRYFRKISLHLHFEVAFIHVWVLVNQLGKLLPGIARHFIDDRIGRGTGGIVRVLEVFTNELCRGGLPLKFALLFNFVKPLLLHVVLPQHLHDLLILRCLIGQYYRPRSVSHLELFRKGVKADYPFCRRAGNPPFYPLSRPRPNHPAHWIYSLNPLALKPPADRDPSGISAT